MQDMPIANILGSNNSLGLPHQCNLYKYQSEVLKPVVEMQFQNSFASYIFEASKENLLDIFENLTLDVEIYHQDRLKKDQLIGIAQVKLTELLKSPIRKTA